MMEPRHPWIQQLWLPVHSLYKIKPVNISAWMGTGSLDPTPSQELLEVDGYGGRKSHFSSGLCLSWVVPDQVNSNVYINCSDWTQCWSYVLLGFLLSSHYLSFSCYFSSAVSLLLWVSDALPLPFFRRTFCFSCWLSLTSHSETACICLAGQSWHYVPSTDRPTHCC